MSRFASLKSWSSFEPSKSCGTWLQKQDGCVSKHLVLCFKEFPRISLRLRIGFLTYQSLCVLFYFLKFKPSSPSYHLSLHPRFHIRRFPLHFWIGFPTSQHMCILFNSSKSHSFLFFYQLWIHPRFHPFNFFSTPFSAFFNWFSTSPPRCVLLILQITQLSLFYHLWICFEVD